MRELCGPAEGPLEGGQLDMVKAAAGQQDGGRARPAGWVARVSAVPLLWPH